jgi:probable F420-dependent oxidoreductase
VFRVYATMDQRMAPSAIAEHARRAEALGYDGLLVPEAVHDGLVAATLALQATARLRVQTSVLVAFPRSPMTIAVAAWDLQALSGGRFELGLGPQVRGNIEGRYSTRWTPPVPRMREYVNALRAIFANWQQRTPLKFEGEHYRFTRMQPFFDPGPLASGPPPIFLGAVGPGMTALAGEVADGMVTHPTNTHPRYVREVIRPRIEKGAARAGRAASRVKLGIGPLCATGTTREEVERDREGRRELLAFLYSTPAYWPSLDLFGWRDRGEALHRMTRENLWKDMRSVVDDEMLNTFVPTGLYRELPAILKSWYAELTDWITFPMPADPSHDADVAAALAELQR